MEEKMCSSGARKLETVGGFLPKIENTSKNAKYGFIRSKEVLIISSETVLCSNKKKKSAQNQDIIYYFCILADTYLSNSLNKNINCWREVHFKH